MPNSESANGNVLQQRIGMGTAAFAFRGYNITNYGRTPELLDHPVYGPTVEAFLREASDIYAEAVRRPVNLVQHARDCKESSMGTYGRDIALIVAVELAQLRLLEQHFGVNFKDSDLTFG